MSEKTKDFFDELKSEFKDLGSKVNKLFDEVVHGNPTDKEFEARADVYQDKDTLVFVMDLPGFDKDNVKIQVRENQLVVRGERVRPAVPETEGYHVRERLFGTFQRTFSLPKGVDIEQIKAKFDKGILTVTLPIEVQEWEEQTIEIE